MFYWFKCWRMSISIPIFWCSCNNSWSDVKLKMLSLFYLLKYLPFRCLIVAISGALGNLLTVLAVPWAQHKRILGFNRPQLKYTTIFIINLAIADFLYCVINLPLYSLTVSIFIFIFNFLSPERVNLILLTVFYWRVVGRWLELFWKCSFQVRTDTGCFKKLTLGR